MNSLANQSNPISAQGNLRPQWCMILPWIAVTFAWVMGFAHAEPIIMDDIQIFDGGLFIDADVEIVNGRVVIKNSSKKEGAKPLPPDPAGPHILQLTDGSQIHGTLVSLGRAAIVWSRADATAPLNFNPAEVQRILLAGPLVPDPKRGGATLKLDSSGWLIGEFVEWKDGKFRMGVGDGAVVDVDRGSVEWLALSPSAAPPEPYDGPVGPMGLSGWDTGTGSGVNWDYADGSLVAKTNAAVSRQFSVLPERVDIEFTAGDGGATNRGFTLWLRPGANVGRGYTPGSYYMRFQASTVNVNYSDKGEIKNFSANIPAEDDAKKLTRYRLLLDRKAGRMLVQANGTQIADWKLPEQADCALAASLSWQPSYISSNMAWTLSNVRVRPWDGDAKPDAHGDEEGKDLIQSADTARIAGVFEGISPEAVNFNGTQIPRKDSIYLRLARKDLPEPPPNPIARISLVSRSQFDVSGIGFKDGKLRVRTSFGGDLTLPVNALRSVEFPHKAALTDKAKRESADVLVFKNGDALHGALVAGSHDKPLHWKPLMGEEAVQFQQANIAGVLVASKLEKRSDKDAPIAGGMVVRFQNGDWLPGNMISLDEQSLFLKSPISERLEIARSEVQTLYFGAGGEVPVWDGASGREEWKKGASMPGYGSNRTGIQSGATPDPWHYLDGAFTLAANAGTRNSNSGPNIGRVLTGLSKKVDITFEVSTAEGPASYAIQLFFDENKPGFMIQGGWDSAYIYDMSPRQQGGVFFNQPQQLDFGGKVGSEGNSRKFRFLADRDSGQMWMYVNGVYVGSIGRRNSSQAPSPKTGTGIAIVPRPMQAQVTVSDIWIAPWTGALPSIPSADNAYEANAPGAIATPEGAAKAKAEQESGESAPLPDQDAVALANGDETLGSVTTADSENLRLRCEVGEIEIPLKRALLVALAGKAASGQKGVRFRFANKGAITVNSFTIEKGNVICSSPTAGSMSFPLSAVSEIIWDSVRSAPVATGELEHGASGMEQMIEIDGILAP